jgi:Protein of unknown function (DUF4058)
MPSPFPGMDPYLEGSLWTSVHSQLASVFVRQLNPQIRPRYIALPTRRFVRDHPEGEGLMIEENIPDVSVHWQQPAPSGIRTIGALVPPLRMATVMRTPVPHITVQIRDVERRHLVAAIDILSPTNKRRGGRRESLRRRDRFLGSDVHLLEIDLLRRGRRVPMEGELPPLPTSSSSAVLTRGRSPRSGRSPWISRCPRSPCPCTRATTMRGWTCSRR